MVLPDIWMMHLESRLISRELKGRTRTATFTEAPAISVEFVGNSAAAVAPERAESPGMGERCNLGAVFKEAVQGYLAVSTGLLCPLRQPQ